MHLEIHERTMKTRHTYIILTAAILMTATSCIKEKLEITYNNQETRIDSYIEGKRYVKRPGQVPVRDPETGEPVTDSETGSPIMKDTTYIDTLAVHYDKGSSRLVLKEGEENGETLSGKGTVALYYAGYTFSGNFSPANLFTTNYRDAAEESGWDLTDASYGEPMLIDMRDEELIEGLRNGLKGVKAGEECEILFSGKYGFGNKMFGIVPANSALLFKIWVVSLTNE